MSLLGLAGTAYGQQNQQNQQNQQTNTGAQPLVLEEVTVTGSRIRRTTDFDTSNPTTVVDDSLIKNLGLINVGEVVTRLPSNVSSDTPSTTGNANFFAGSTITNLRGLNPFFGSRTLTLVNTRRFVPTNQGDGVDLNFIPSVLIDHIDIVTGGASAAYGSGAISGVQNIFLNTTLDGLRVDVDGYRTTESDGTDKHAGIAYGHAFLDDRVHFVVGYEYQKSDAVECTNRAWCQESTGFITGGEGQPSNVLESNVRENQLSYTGVFNNFVPGATTTQQADSTGTQLQTFNIGQGVSTVPFNDVVGGDGVSIYYRTNLTAPIDRNVAGAAFSFDITDSLRMTFDADYGKVETTNFTAEPLNANLQTIHPDNAYVQLNPGLQPAVDPVFGAALNKNWTSQNDPYSRFTTEVKRASLGFDGQFGDSTWTWSGYYTYGNTQREQLVANNRHLYAYQMAIDSVLDANGNPVCRVTRDGFAAAAAVTPSYSFADERIAQGCVPLDPFGDQPIPQDAFDYSWGFLDEDLDYTQDVWAFDASGNFWKGIGDNGPFQMAAGVEYRKEIGHNLDTQNGAPEYIRTDYLIQYGDSFSGKVDVTEGFLEFNLPLLKDKPAASRLEFNSAVRLSRYKNTGLEGTTGEQRTHDFTTWKISAIWDPVDWLRFRSSRSRDLRAANFRELYYGQFLHAGGAFGYCGPTGTFQADPCDWSLEGNVDLDPERSDTTTFGIVFTPVKRLESFQFAADYFNIDINGAIQQANPRRVLDGCQISNLPEFCALLVPDVPGTYAYNPVTNSGIASLRALAFNGSGYKFSGVDFTGNYTLDFRRGGSLNFRLLATRMLQQEFQPTPGQPFVDIVGQTGTSNSFLSDNQPTADWLSTLWTTYNRGPINVTGQLRYVSSGVMNYYGITPEDPGYATAAPPLVTMSTNSVPSYTLFALSGSYTFETRGPDLQLYASIYNLFDKDPPVAAGTPTFVSLNANGGTNAVFFDTLGRAYRVGLRLSF